MRGTTSFVREHVGLSVAGKMGSSGSYPFVQVGLMQLPQETTDSVRMRSTSSEGLFRWFAHDNERKSLLVSTE